MILMVEAAGLREFCREYGEPARLRDYAKLVLGAAPLPGRARRSRPSTPSHGSSSASGNWHKTSHSGAHLDGVVATVPPSRGDHR